MTLSDSLNYSPYKLPNIRNHFGIAKYEILKSMSDMAKEENPNIHTLSNILEKFEEIYILWYNILFFINQIDEDIKNGRGQEWLTNPFYKSQMPKGEFETTKDYKIKIDNLLESDKKDVNLLKEDLSLLFHTEIKEFLSTHYELLLNIISSETQFLCTCHFHDNYDADTEWFKIKPYIKINSHSTFSKNHRIGLQNLFNISTTSNVFPFTAKDPKRRTTKHFYYKIKIPLEKAQDTIENIRKNNFEFNLGEGRYKLLVSLKYEFWNDGKLYNVSEIIELLYQRLIGINEIKYFSVIAFLRLPQVVLEINTGQLIDEVGESYPLCPL